MANYIETQLKITEVDATRKTVERKETYIVDALSFTEAEKTVIDRIGRYISGVFSVEAVKKRKLSDVFFMSKSSKVLANEEAKMINAASKGKKEAEEAMDAPVDWDHEGIECHFYEVRIQYIEIDEKTLKEKRCPAVFLVESPAIDSVIDEFRSRMRLTTIDYEITGVKKTSINNVLLYKES